MTGIRDQGSGDRKNKPQLVLTSVFCLLLSSCTLFRPSSQEGWPDRSSIQPGEEIVVGKNQNVYGLARKYGVPMRDVIVLNDLKPPFVLKPGDHLIMPAKMQDYAPVPAAAPVAGIEKKTLESVTPEPTASSQAVTSMQLEPPPKVEPAKPQPQPTTITAPVQQPPKPVATTVQAGAQKTAALSKPAEAPSAASKAAMQFAWPVQGPILSEFGPKGQGTNNDGINIGAPKGAPVAAAAGGIVVYAGNEMKGFGNLVLIRHEGGWVTAYAHLDRMLVNKDTVVAPGDMIGTIGSTGGVATPQLHFETRLEGKAVDPQTVIKKAS